MKKELNEQFVIDLSKKKNEPEWMLEFRLKSYRKFKELDNPNFGPKLEFDFENINIFNFPIVLFFNKVCGNII